MADDPKTKDEGTAEVMPEAAPEEADQLARPYSLEEIEAGAKPPKLVKVKYSGPDGMSNDAAGGELVSGETYEVPEDVKDELLAHPGGWWK